MESTKSSLARIKIKFPDQLWISEIFKKFHDVRMEIEYFLPYDFENSIGNSIIEIFHYNIDLIIEEVKNHKSVIEFSILEKDENRVKFNVKTKDPFLLYAIIKFGVLINFPVRVRDGYAFWRLVSSRESIDKLLTLFDQKGFDYSLLRIGTSPYNIDDDKNKLTLDESTILNKSISLGFFEIPRKISLEELANVLGKSKSSLSVTLRKIIKKKVMFEM
ncbi:MAG TPA: helix-turn-helix domain-containing protein [Candidatus Nanopelagicaceae bacterium]|nr:helix-turn-helix domain-containing protein [Candidatus Nanopelagicaceae bacterium]